MTETGVLSDIRFQPALESLAKRLRIRPGSRVLSELEGVFTAGVAAARPKAAYRVAYVEAREGDSLLIDGQRFTSRVLRVNLHAAHRVFFYLATCGEEMEAWSQAQSDDLVRQYWADALKEMALRTAMRALQNHLNRQFELPKTSAMSPGSLEDWPISEQRPLFDLMDGLDRTIGVRLTESMLMLPVKSISGVRFVTENRFESCQLCPRPDCPGRRAPYDSNLYTARFS